MDGGPADVTGLHAGATGEETGQEHLVPRAHVWDKSESRKARGNPGKSNRHMFAIFVLTLAGIETSCGLFLIDIYHGRQ